MRPMSAVFVFGLLLFLLLSFQRHDDGWGFTAQSAGHAHDTIHTFREVCRSSEVFAFRTFTHEAYGLFCLCLSTTPNAQRKPNGQNVAKQIKGISIFLLILIADNLVLLGVACGSIKEVSEERLSANTTLCLESVCALLCSFFLSLPLAAFRPPCCSAVCPP